MIFIEQVKFEQSYAHKALMVRVNFMVTNLEVADVPKYQKFFQMLQQPPHELTADRLLAMTQLLHEIEHGT